MSASGSEAVTETTTNKMTAGQFNKFVQRLETLYGIDSVKEEVKTQLRQLVDAHQENTEWVEALDLIPFSVYESAKDKLEKHKSDLGDILYRDVQFRQSIAPMFEGVLKGSSIEEAKKNWITQVEAYATKYPKASSETATAPVNLTNKHAISQSPESLNRHWLTDADLAAAKEGVSLLGVNLFP